MGIVTRYRIVQRAVVLIWAALLVAAMVWFFKQESVSGDQVAVLMGFFALSGGGVWKIYSYNPGEGRK